MVPLSQGVLITREICGKQSGTKTSLNRDNKQMSKLVPLGIRPSFSRSRTRLDRLIRLPRIDPQCYRKWGDGVSSRRQGCGYLTNGPTQGWVSAWSSPVSTAYTSRYPDRMAIPLVMWNHGDSAAIRAGNWTARSVTPMLAIAMFRIVG